MNGDINQAYCRWCSSPFSRKKVGAHEKEFCSPECKNSFNSALRRHGRTMFDKGEVTIDELKGL